MTLSLNQVQITSGHARGVSQVLKRSSWGHQRSKIKLESFCHLWNQTEPNNDRLQDDSISITQNDFYGFNMGWLMNMSHTVWLILLSHSLWIIKMTAWLIFAFISSPPYCRHKRFFLFFHRFLNQYTLDGAITLDDAITLDSAIPRWRYHK